MSFRYTNALVGELKQKILLQRALKDISTRTFKGRCNGVTLVYSAHGRVSNIQVEKEKESLYFDDKEGRVRGDALSTAIRAAIWQANQQLRNAKEEAYRSTFQFNTELKKKNDFTMWFAQDGASLHPLPYEALNNEGANDTFINSLRNSGNTTTIASTDRDLAPALECLEDHSAVMKEYRRELGEDESFFWKRVELMRRSQSNTIKGVKRAYKDAPTPAEDFEEKVQLKFAASRRV